MKSQSIASCRPEDKKHRPGCFTETTAVTARLLTDGARLSALSSTTDAKTEGKDTLRNCSPPVILPWIGFGTYRLGKDQAMRATLQALEAGYRSIDTAFIYGGEGTERLVGQAVHKALENGILQCREQVFVTTKHWRKFHGYEPSLECLRLSLKRLQLEYVDLWLMHWPGPAWSTMTRRKERVDEDRWQYATKSADEVVSLRAETWRAMEDAHRKGLARAIGVSNMTVSQLETLKMTAKLWPPAVNQVELHPLYPQTKLLEYCRKEGILVQAYASLGGQDAGKTVWSRLLGVDLTRKKQKLNLMLAEPVVRLAEQLALTPAQTLLQYGLRRGCALIPKTTSKERLGENAGALSGQCMSEDQANQLQQDLLDQVRRANPDHEGDLELLTRLCWRSDPLRHLDFD